ncbi:MAG: LD-carboxypeptidase [Candidatus Gastranaerophilaceae bacterium]
MNLIKPKNLEKNDTICIIAPAGGVDNDENINRAIKYFESQDYKIKLGKNLLKRNNYLAGTDNERLEDLHNAFLDNSVNAIICLRGGYGAIRLINKIDYNLVKNNPKIFAGYSDITALSLMFLKKSNLITYSAPMIQSDFGQNEPNKFTLDSFFNTVTNNNQKEYLAPKVYNSGNCEGILFGGNLATTVSLCGLDFIPDKKFIFFAEDLNESTYKIDKMLTQLFNIEKFKKNISGLVLGEFLYTDNECWLNDLFTDISNSLNIPTISGLKISHATEKLTLPIGIKSAISGNILKF